MIFDKEQSERGSAFILALMVVAAVGLLVVPVIYLATTGLRSTNLAQQRYLDRYAADAGVEEGIWHVQHDPGYTPVPGATVRYTPTFNNQQITIDVEPAALPTPMPMPTTTPMQFGSPLSISKNVEPNFAFACFLGAACPTTTFSYTIFIENYRTSSQDLFDVGDCLPPGFTFVEFTAVNYIHKDEGGSPLLTVADMNSFYVDEDDDDEDQLCSAGREMVAWVLEDDDPYILSGETAEIRFTVTAQTGEPDTHYNLAWVNGNDEADDDLPEDLDDAIVTGLTSPLVFIVPTYDISSSVGGTTIEARATVWKYPGNNESYILSWQVE